MTKEEYINFIFNMWKFKNKIIFYFIIFVIIIFIILSMIYFILKIILNKKENEIDDYMKDIGYIVSSKYYYKDGKTLDKEYFYKNYYYDINIVKKYFKGDEI